VDDTSSRRTRRARVPSEIRRGQLVEAARRVFADAGYDGASTAAIADAADCQETVLYRHFPSKIALLREVLAAIRVGSLGPAITSAEAPGAEPIVAAALSDEEKRRDLGIVVSAISVAHRDPDVADALVDAFGAARAMIVAVVTDGRERGRIRADADPEAVAWLWQGLVLASVMRDSVRRDGVADGAVAAARLLDGLLDPAAGTPG